MSGYIGTQPVPQATQTRQTFVATAAQTSFATGGYQAGYLDVFLNGVKLQDGVDYTATNGSDIVLTVGAALDDTLEVVAYTAFEVVNAATAAQGALADTAVQPNDSPTFADLTLSGGVYLGGVGAANKLDDYEEGTWTPTDASSAGLSLSVLAASYTKIGRLCYIYAYIQYPSTSSSLNQQTGGLPFAAKGGVTYTQLTVRVTSSTVSASNLTFQVYPMASVGVIESGAGAVTNGALSSTDFLISGVYETA